MSMYVRVRERVCVFCSCLNDVCSGECYEIILTMCVCVLFVFE